MKIQTKLLLAAILAIPVTAPRAYADNSTLLGVSISRQGAASGDLDGPFASFLKSLAEDEQVKLTPSGPVEVWKWQGDAFRTDRIKFTQSALQAALENAGWDVKPFTDDEVRYTNVFNHFTDETSPNFLSPDNHGYWRATHAATRRAILGAWFSTRDTLALGLIPTQYQAKPKPQPLPGAGAEILVKNINDTGASLPRVALPKFPALSRKPRMVRGYLFNSGGRPIAGGEVAVHVSAGGGFRTTHKARSNAQGLYEVLLPAGVAEVVQVDTDVNYNGQKFNLALSPLGGAAKGFNATAGHVEHFYLPAMQGESGGTIFVKDNLDKGTVEITLTPVGRMLDGSLGGPHPHLPLRRRPRLRGIPQRHAAGPLQTHRAPL